MNKNEMIEHIQNEERKRWDLLKRTEELFGAKDKVTVKRRAAWCAIYELMESMNIPFLDHADPFDLAKLDAE